MGIADPDEACMAARLMNALFGGTPHSMLFRSVREKLSLCYYCASSYDYIKGVMLVDSGVEAAKADEAQAEILRQLDLLRQGAFIDEDLEAAGAACSTSSRRWTISSLAGWAGTCGRASALGSPRRRNRRPRWPP